MGLFSRKKDSGNQEMKILGIEGQASSLKCLILAGIKGVSLQTTFSSEAIEVDQVHSYQYINQNEKAPNLTHGDFSIAGVRGILTYIDIRGKGGSLIPRKARVLGLQNYWTDVCNEKLAPSVQEIVNKNSSSDADACCKEILSSLDSVLNENLFVAGPLTLADPNVAAYIYVLKSHDIDLTSYPNIASWISRLEEEMSGELKTKYLPLLSSKSKQQAA